MAKRTIVTADPIIVKGQLTKAVLDRKRAVADIAKSAKSVATEARRIAKK